ncbi:MAG: hypothetical protein IPK76_19705 [Lewinellaceae bacterium]|nr:hypothetical protein [Lewinellaceae bacterium]
MKRAVLLIIAVFACLELFSQLPAVQTLPFAQNWSNTAQLSVTDDWSG